MSPKQVVKAFYESDFVTDTEVVSKFIHPDCLLHWNSSDGYRVMDYGALQRFFSQVSASYNSVKSTVSHLLEDGNMVTIRFTLVVSTIEDPDNEQSLANFISIWEVKEGKLFRGYEISQGADDNQESYKSYSQIKVD